MSQYFVNDDDLDAIFLSINESGATGHSDLTGYEVNNIDLQSRYAKWVFGTYASQTYYKSYNYSYQDLNKVFQNIQIPIVPYKITPGTGTYSETAGPNYKLTFNPGTTTIQFLVAVNLTITAIGGGGGGRQSANVNITVGFSTYYNCILSGPGGGGAASVQGTYSIPSNNTLSINVGAGGIGGTSTQSTANAYPGGQTTVTNTTSNTTTIINCPGGKASSGRTDYVNGSSYIFYFPATSNSDIATLNGVTQIYNYYGGGSPYGGGYYSPSALPHGGYGIRGEHSPESCGGGGSATCEVTSGAYLGSLQGICGNSGNNSNGGIGGLTTETETEDPTFYNAVDASSTAYGVGGGGGGGYFHVRNGATDSVFGTGGSGGPGVVIIEFTYSP